MTQTDDAPLKVTQTDDETNTDPNIDPKLDLNCAPHFGQESDSNDKSIEHLTIGVTSDQTSVEYKNGRIDNKGISAYY